MRLKHSYINIQAHTHTHPYSSGPPAAFGLLHSRPSPRSNKHHLNVQILTTITGHILTTLIYLSCLSLSPFLSLLPCVHTHTHTILPHQCYILLKRVSEAERPITLTRRECQKRKLQRIWWKGQFKWTLLDFNCKCLIAPIIMGNKTLLH